jgi:hypothetical protein
MGPLVVTGVLGRGNHPFVLSKDSEIKDSKIMFVSGEKKSYEQVEKISLGLFFLVHGFVPERAEDFIEQTSLEKNCCSVSPDICFKNLPVLPGWTSKDKIFQFINEFRAYLAGQKFDILGMKSSILCPRSFNKFFDENRSASKSYLDYLHYGKIIKNFFRQNDCMKIQAGKIGGLKNYASLLRYSFSDCGLQTKQEKPEISTYLLCRETKQMEVNFIQDVESKYFLPALASIVGKYVRELFIYSINLSLGNKNSVSGYRDHKTRDFIRKVLPDLPVLGVAQKCLLRER